MTFKSPGRTYWSRAAATMRRLWTGRVLQVAISAQLGVIIPQPGRKSNHFPVMSLPPSSQQRDHHHNFVSRVAARDLLPRRSDRARWGEPHGGGAPMAGGPRLERKTTAGGRARNAFGPLVTFNCHTVTRALTHSPGHSKAMQSPRSAGLGAGPPEGASS